MTTATPLSHDVYELEWYDFQTTEITLEALRLRYLSGEISGGQRVRLHGSAMWYRVRDISSIRDLPRAKRWRIFVAVAQELCHFVLSVLRILSIGIAFSRLSGGGLLASADLVRSVGEADTEVRKARRVTRIVLFTILLAPVIAAIGYGVIFIVVNS
jgi:hypothetical protein